MEEKNKPILVSDWSQKYKLMIYAVSGMWIIVFGVKLVRTLNDIKELLQKILLK